jgi:carboxymethylenebutenolidase
MEDPRTMDLSDEPTQELLDRREFFKKMSVIAGCTAAVCALPLLLENGEARAQIVPKDDSRLYTENIKYPGATGEVRAYLARPKGDEKLPGVIVVPEIYGLNSHIEDVTRRVALEGLLAIAPDPLSPLGGTPDDRDKARAFTQKLDEKSTIENYLAAVKYLKNHPQSNGKVGVIGFCWGGGMANQLAVHSPDLAAAVPYYGMQSALEDVPKIKAPLLLHYAGNDERINKGIPAFEAALKQASINYKIYIYEDTRHGFNNETDPRYNKEAAQLSWQRTISFLKEKLRK